MQRGDSCQSLRTPGTVALPRVSVLPSLSLPDFLSPSWFRGCWLLTLSTRRKRSSSPALSRARRAWIHGFLLIITPPNHFDPLQLTGLPLETCKAVVNPFALHCFALLSPLVKLEVPEREAVRARGRAHIIHTLWTSPRVTQIQLQLRLPFHNHLHLISLWANSLARHPVLGAQCSSRDGFSQLFFFFFF